MEKKEAIAIVPEPTHLICSRCQNVINKCIACDKEFYCRDPIYCFHSYHYCEECGENCDCKMD